MTDDAVWVVAEEEAALCARVLASKMVSGVDVLPGVAGAVWDPIEVGARVG